MKSTVDYYFRAYAPSCVTQKVDSLILKKKEIDDAVKDKINEVFTTCERIIDHYIPDTTYERPAVDEDACVFSRMNMLSHEITTRVCDHFLPFLTEKNDSMKTQLKQKTEEMKPMMDTLNKVKDQCVETVKPVVEPFYPITTPLFALIVLIFSTIYLILKTVVYDPVYYVYGLCKKTCTDCSDDFKADEKGNRPIVAKATAVYNQAKDALMALFVDENGKVTMDKFQELCKTKKEEYEKLVKENVTAEKLQAFLEEASKQVKSVVDEKMVAPVKNAEEEGKKYYDELVKLFTNEEGKFDVSRVQEMVGKSGEELKKVLEVAKGKMADGKEVVVKEATKKVTELGDVVSSRLEGVRDYTLTMVSVMVGLLLLFPTICFLMTVFVISYIIDLDQIVPSPAMKKIISAIDTMEIKENTDGNRTTVTIKYDSEKPVAKPVEDDDEL